MGVRKVIYILMLAVLASCKSKYQKMMESSDYDAQYALAKEYYEAEDYYKAYSLFENLIPVYRLTDKAEEVTFLTAKCYYEEGDYLMAAYYFNKFILTFSSSESLEEAYYFKALSYYYNSPKVSLDQTYTYQAIEAFQMYINKFFGGIYVKDSNGYIAELRQKLEEKAFDKAKLYYTLGDYKAAVVDLKNCLKEYPDTKYREELIFMYLESSFLLAEKSVDDKKQERYEYAVYAYEAYIDEFPQGKRIKDAERIFDQIRKRNSNSEIK